jgi:hypothetical protein
MYLFWSHAKPSMLVYALYISVRIVFDKRVSDTGKQKKDSLCQAF